MKKLITLLLLTTTSAFAEPSGHGHVTYNPGGYTGGINTNPGQSVGGGSAHPSRGPDLSVPNAQIQHFGQQTQAYQSHNQKLDAFIAQSKATVYVAPKPYDQTSAIEKLQQKWIDKKIPEIDTKLKSFEADGLRTEISRWKEHTFHRRQTLVLADEYSQSIQRLRDNQAKVSKEIYDYTTFTFEAGIESLTETAQIAGGTREGNFDESLAESKSMHEIGKAILDIGMGLTPGISIGKDAYEALSGKSLIDGSTLDLTSRSFAVLGVATLGGSNIVKSSFNGLIKIAKVLHTRQVLGHGFKSAIKLTHSRVTNVVRHSPHNPHALHEKVIKEGDGPFKHVADTFRSGTFHTYQTAETTVLYRVAPTSAADAIAHESNYWTRIKPSSPTQAMIDSALDRSWNNTAGKWVEIHVPAGETLHEGLSAGLSRLGSTNMSDFVGGGNQIYINKHIPKEWVQKVERF